VHFAAEPQVAFVVIAGDDFVVGEPVLGQPRVEVWRCVDVVVVIVARRLIRDVSRKIRSVAGGNGVAIDQRENR
jgi:hypothetical protein